MRTVKLGWSCFAALFLASGARVTHADPAPAAAPPGQIVLRSTPLGPMTTNINDMSITPDGQHIAVAAYAGTRREVFIDGNESQVYSSLVQMPSLGDGGGKRGGGGAAPRLLMISPDQTRFAYVATKGPTNSVMVINQKESPVFDRINGAMFSPTGHRLMYVASRGGKQMVVVDGAVSAPYQQVSLLKFSEDGKHYGFLAQVSIKPLSYRVVVDGKEGPAYASISKMELGRTGRAAYVVNIGSELKPLDRQARADDALYDNHMVIDGQEGPKYAVIQPAVFSEDGNHVGYIAMTTSRRPKTWVAVIDGQAGPEFTQLSNITFSPDGKRYAYSGIDASAGRSATYAVVDGKKSLDYASCDSYTFSPDSQHIAYVATKGKKVCVFDGKEAEAHDDVLLTPTCFSADSKRFAYIATDINKMYLVLDGKIGPAQPSIDMRSVRFTTDSQHCRFKVGISADASFYAMDDQSLDSAAPALDLAATADNRHIAIVAAKDVGTSSQTCRAALDGKPIGETYQGISQLQISADGNHVAYIGVTSGSDKNNNHAVYDGHEGPGYFRIEKIVLSPDGRHFAYACTEDGSKHYVVVDSFQGPVYDGVFLGVTGQFEGLKFTADGSLSFLPVKDGKLSHVIMTPDAIAAIPKPTGGAGSGAPAASAPAGYSKVYTFGGVPKDGSLPAVLTAAPDGTLFGGTNGGGKYQMGVLFKCGPDGSGYTILHNFAGGQTDGMRPTSIAIGPDGAVYGGLQVQGKGGAGCIFRCSADGSDYKSLYNFSTAKEGSAPVIEAIEPDGTICGMSGNGRPMYIFRAKPDGSEVKRVFDATKVPDAAQNGIGKFTDGGDGYYYGAAGTILFKIKKDGTGYSVLRKFDGPPTDARYADEAPILGSDGKLYGFDKDGGQARGGTIFTLGRDGSGYKLIVDPDTGPDQLLPAALVEGSDGKLYAFVHAGVARCNKDGSGYEVLKGTPKSGGFPWTAMVHGGALYGISDEGPNRGLIYRYGIGGGATAAGGASAGPTAVVQNVPPTPLDGNVDFPAADTLK